MPDGIFGLLDPVRRRQRTLLVLRWAVLGLLAGSLFSLVAGIWRWQNLSQSVQFWALAFLVVGPLAGALVGVLRWRGWKSAAAAVDTHYRLKDRAITAVDLIGRNAHTPVHELQLADTEQHLEALDPRKVAPFRLTASLPLAIGTAVIALTVLLWPTPTPVQAKPAEPLESVVAAAEDAQSGLENLAEESRKQDNKELRSLIEQFAQKLDEMKQPGVDVKEALAKLSEMQSSIAAQQALYNVGLVDAQMSSLGEAMASTQALESAGQALQQQKYEKAADALEQAEAKFERKEAKNLKEKLKKAATAQGEAGLGELSETTAEMADTLDDGQAFPEAARKLAKLARAQGRRKHISDLLSLLSSSLSECKSNCQKNGGAKILARNKSTRPSSTWGRAVSGNLDGEKTKLDSERKRDQVQGQADEGPSEVETTHSPEGRQLASRSYAENYAKYRRRTEAALNSEPIPLGHRQTIRRYFELIRPQGDEVEQSAVKPQAGGKQ
jgi:hypothetical protein